METEQFVSNGKIPVVINGASGFLGTHLCAQLIGSGTYEVTVIVRSEASRQRLFRQLHALLDDTTEHGFTVLEGDPTDLSFMREALRNQKVVFHCAACVKFDADDPSELISTNVLLTEIAVRAALESTDGVFVHTSSVAALGHCTYPEPITEETPYESLANRSPYSISKFYAENEVWKGVEKGLRAVIVNPSVILGAGDRDSPIYPLLRTVCKGNPFYTEGIKGYVDVRDVAQVMIRLSETPEALGQRFLLNAANLSYRDVFELIAREMGKKRPSLPLPKVFLQTAALLSGKIAKRLGGQPVLTPHMVQSAYSKTVYDGSRITRTLEFQYTSIENTVAEMCRSFAG